MLRVMKLVLGIGCLLALSSNTWAAAANGGIKICGAEHFQRLGGTETHSTGYSMRNRSDSAVIVINYVLVTDGDGSVIFSGVPSNTGFRQFVFPFQGSRWVLEDILGTTYYGGASRPLTVRLSWSTFDGADAEIPGMGSARFVRDGSGNDSSRHSSGQCADVNLTNAP